MPIRPRPSTLLSLVAAGGLAACVGGGPTPPERPAEVVSLGQGWAPETAAAVHHAPQGTVIMPTAWLSSLEAGPFSREPLLSPASMSRFGFIADEGGASVNPYGMPLGFASTGTRVPVDPADPADARTVEATGFTCAACHTGQLEYEGKLLRVEGGQAYHDARAFQDALAKSVVATWLLPSKYARFRAKAVERGFPEDKIDARFETAFDAAWGGIKARLKGEPDLYPTYEGPGRLDALQRIANQLFAEDLKIGENNLTGEGPVSFPYLWDIWLFDWVQYNGSVRQPMVRNVGEALGVNARTNLVDANGRPNPDPERWRSTVRVRDIHAVETAYETLGPPRWPAEDVLPPVDRTKAAEGRRLFVERCAGCHAVKMITDRPVTRPRDGAKVFEWHVPVIPLAAIGTDPVAATSFARNRYDASKLGVAEPIGAAEGLRLVAGKVKDQAYDDAKVPAAERGKLDGFGRENLVTAPCGYRARPLVGVWATPPFLHNGSVPSLIDLLSEERPARFAWGSREFDPVKVGYVTTPGSGARVFDTTLAGNGNAGHWFTDDATRPGRLGPALEAAEREAIVEYLKAATPEDYPAERTTSAKLRPQPCGDDPDWAGVTVAGR